MGTIVMNSNQALFPSLHQRKETSEVLSQHLFFGCCKFGSQGRTANFEAVTVLSFIIGRSCFPAAEHNAYPFVSKSSQCGMMRFSPLSLLVIVGPRPIGLKDGLCSELMEGLPQEFGTGQTPVNPNALSAFLSDGSDAGELLDFGCLFETVAIGAERRQQTRSQSRTRSRKTAKQRRVVMLLKQRGNLFIVVFNGFRQRRDLFDERLNHHCGSQQYGAILGQRQRLLDVGDQLIELVLTAISLNLIELADRGRSGSFQLLQGWPALKKSTSSSGMQITKPVQSLRKVHLQRRRQLIGQCGAFIDETTPALRQQLNAAG